MIARVLVVSITMVLAICTGAQTVAPTFTERQSINPLALSWPTENRIVVFQSDGRVATYVVTNKRMQLISLRGVGGEIAPLARWSAEAGHLAIVRASGQVMVWSRSTERIEPVDLQICELTCITWSADGVLALGATDGKVQLWDQKTRKTLRVFDWEPSGGAINSLSWRPNSNRLAIANAAGDLVEYDLLSNRAKRVSGHVPAGGMAGMWAHWSPNGTRLAVFVGARLCLRLWEDGQFLPNCTPTGAFNGSAEWRPDDSVIAYTSTNSLWLRTIAKPAPRQVIAGGCPTAMAWDPSGEFLVVGLPGAAIRIIAPASGEVLNEIELRGSM